jgi:predicted nucleotidyltransferase
MRYGIPDKSMEMIINALEKIPEIDKTIIFVSRAMGNYKNGSDIDLAVFGRQVSNETVNKLKIELNEELPLPYYFDIICYDSIKNDELKKHIDMHGKPLYEKSV